MGWVETRRSWGRGMQGLGGYLGSEGEGKQFIEQGDTQ